MKRLVITIFISLIVIGLPIFFWIKSKNDLIKKQTLIPRFSISELLPAVVDEQYEADIFALIVGAKAKMQITGIDIPIGLNITNCNQNYNYSDIPKPNTVISCKLVGILNETGQIELSLKVGADGYRNSVIQKYSLNVIP